MNDSNSTSRFCKKCQCDTVRYKDGHCKPCANKRVAAWRKEFPEKEKAQKADWHKRNIDAIHAQKAEYYIKNKERIDLSVKIRELANPLKKKVSDARWRANNKNKVKESTANRYQKNKEKMLKQAAAWKSNNINKVRRLSAKWRIANRESIGISRQNRRARLQANGGSLSEGIASKLFNLQHGRCACCRLPLGRNYHMDHIMPLALGGANTDDNIQLLRQRCNLQKSAKHPIDFMQSRGFLL